MRHQVAYYSTAVHPGGLDDPPLRAVHKLRKMVRLAAHAGAKAFLPISACPLRPCVQDKLDAWDPSRADDVQYLMNMAKKYVILDTLVANGGKCTYEVLFARADEVCTHQAP